MFLVMFDLRSSIVLTVLIAAYLVWFWCRENLGEYLAPVKCIKAPPVALAAVHSKAVVLL